MGTDRILLATDGTESALAATREAIEIAANRGATLHAIYVIEPPSDYDNDIIDREELEADLLATGTNVLEDVEAAAAAASVPIRTTIDDGRPGDVLLSYAKTEDVDLIVVGAYGDRSGVTYALLGSTADALVRESRCPVLVCPPTEE
ncbi:universal stress protein [Halalkalirubrum salinum]|uniref:universal stress protein n=1 Tax=Halalkalirubrum salinum TaxID=2563889 RepID=UPI0010FB02B8|nr:universal stress protein [Halalkalirubrum salinum]